MPQRKNETSLGVTAAKAERNIWMVQGQILNTISNGQSAAKALIEQGSTTIPIAGVGWQAIGHSKW